jgi:hypothetical protein
MVKKGVDIMDKKQWALLNDNRIYEVALYHETQGMCMAKRVNPDKIFERFMEFKRYVMRGSFTLEELEDRVYGQNGVMPSNMEFNESQFIKNLNVLAQKMREQDQEKDKENGKTKE